MFGIMEQNGKYVVFNTWTGYVISEHKYLWAAKRSLKRRTKKFNNFFSRYIKKHPLNGLA